jgi:hypothetical protein
MAGAKARIKALQFLPQIAPDGQQLVRHAFFKKIVGRKKRRAMAQNMPFFVDIRHGGKHQAAMRKITHGLFQGVDGLWRQLVFFIKNQ